MADKDILEKVLMLYADVFADCENVLVYGGEQTVHAENLQLAPTESFYWGGNNLHNQFCDVSFYLVNNGEIRAQYIIGNETQLEPRQVLRKASYQGGAYRQQLKSKNAVYPVISIVIDWTGKTTRIPLSLHTLLRQNGASQKCLEMVDDVKLSVLHMKRLPEDIRDKFTSDLGFVVDFLNEENFEKRREQKIIHAEALCRMMEALTGDARFTAAMDKILRMQREGDEIKMCEYIDMLEARGQAKGEIRGENRLALLLEKLYSMGRDEDAKLAVMDENIRKILYQELCIL